MRVRDYICAYQALRQGGEKTQDDTMSDLNIATPVKIEKLVKDFKTHRCTLDFASIVKTE